MIKYNTGRQITVYELIEMLKRCGPESVVETEGCDCVGECCGLVEYTDDKRVIISRWEGH